MSLPPAPPASPRPSPSLAAPAAALLSGAADELAAALIVLQADGKLLHANAAAQALLHDAQDWQLDAAQRLHPTRPAARTAFESALAAARAGDATGRLPLAGVAGARLGVLPGPEGSPPCLLLSLQPAPGLAADLPSYAAAHGLSPTETRVLQRLALGEGSARAAAALGLQATTVRTHVLALRRKTGQPSLAALVQTLARLPPVRPRARAGPAAAEAGGVASPR